MLKLFYDAESVIHNFMGFAAINIYKCANSTGVVFKRRFI